MNIHLTPEQEAIVKAELESGNFRTAEEVVAEALRTLAEKQVSLSATTNGEQRAAVAEMLKFVEANRVTLKDVSVKELIHEGHRL